MICPHCQHNTIRQVGQSIDCTNLDCEGFMLTLAPEIFMNLTADDFEDYRAGRSDQTQMDIDQAAFEQRLRDYEIARIAREANRRAGNEPTFG